MATYSGEFMFIKKIILTSMLILSSGWAQSQSFDLGIQPQFWALDSQEYTLDFDSKVELKTMFTPSDEKIKSQVNRQVEFLFGAFDNNHRQGVPKVNHNIEITSVKNDSSNLHIISYHYKGTVQVSGSGSKYQFYLPTNPDNVYLKSIVVKNGVSQYPCGDSQHYQSQYFWYFFNPKAYGCPLKENVDYFAVTGTLSDLPSTTETFPEYERMLDAEGNLKVSVFYGLNTYGDTNPNTSRDINATSVRAMRSLLLKDGFSSYVLSFDEITKILENRTFDVPYVETFTKSINTNQGTHVVQVQLFFGSTDINGGYGFHKFFAAALMRDSVVIYAGHSGLGSYLSPSEIKKTSNISLQLPKNQYQLIFFNGCSSYPYYGAPYFQMKATDQDPAGTKNLDIMTNGLATYFSAITPSNQAVMNAILNYAETGLKTSYQKIITEADSGNLLSILGDEDNN